MAEFLGLPIPDEGPAFLVILLIHILAGLTGVVCGATAALTRKGGSTHVRFGRLYGWALVAIIATMAAMAGMRWRGCDGKKTGTWYPSAWWPEPP